MRFNLKLNFLKRDSIAWFHDFRLHPVSFQPKIFLSWVEKLKTKLIEFLTPTKNWLKAWFDYLISFFRRSSERMNENSLKQIWVWFAHFAEHIVRLHEKKPNSDSKSRSQRVIQIKQFNFEWDSMMHSDKRLVIKCFMFDSRESWKNVLLLLPVIYCVVSCWRFVFFAMQWNLSSVLFLLTIKKYFWIYNEWVFSAITKTFIAPRGWICASLFLLYLSALSDSWDEK